MRESEFQAKLIRKIRDLFPDCIVLKNDPNYIQGMPDLTILFRNGWAVLECKNSAKAHAQPNQVYYIQKLNRMGFASFVYPENELEILDALQQSFES
ncbi:MAG: nuclease [Chaetfec virus UA24_144]|nr:MAG: nuclease [Chaetfec virus UA24_144]